VSLIKYETDKHIAYITMNRPEKLNAITPNMLSGLWDAFTDLRDNPDIWLGVVTGTGRAFSVGHDLKAMSTMSGEDKASGGTDQLYLMQQNITKPIIAAVNGLCLAQGGGIAMGSDILIASETAQFGWPQTKRGLSSISGPVILSRRIPHGKAMELLFTGGFLSAQDALSIGLVNYVVPESQLIEKTNELAYKILENAPIAVRGMKEAVLPGNDETLKGRLNRATEIFERVRNTADAQEGLDAFKEKRPPIWKGH
jgi:E-phenylitaconyl-CoA hydratase